MTRIRRNWSAAGRQHKLGPADADGTCRHCQIAFAQGDQVWANPYPEDGVYHPACWESLQAARRAEQAAKKARAEAFEASLRPAPKKAERRCLGCGEPLGPNDVMVHDAWACRQAAATRGRRGR